MIIFGAKHKKNIRDRHPEQMQGGYTDVSILNFS